MDKYNRGNQGVFESSTGRYAKFSANLRNLLGGIASQVDKQITPLLYMDPNSTSHMLTFLNLQEQVSLLQTCKSLRKDVGRKLSVNRLLFLVAQGRQDEAEAMIRKNPKLLLQSGDITDGAGRYFKCITALQYAVWALDAHMWTMILPYFDRINARASAVEQVRALEENGTAHGRHFDFKPLLDAYAVYFRSPSQESWCRGIGGAQRLLPDHVVQEYTTPDRSFHPTPSFAVADAWRPSVHCQYGVRWWRTHELNNGGVLGTGWAAYRGECDGAGLVTVLLYWGEVLVTHDQAAIEALCRQRCAELTDLLTRYGVGRTPAAESKSPGRR